MALEDFTTYTETDPDGVVSVDATTVSWTGLDEVKESHVVTDKGAAHFSGDFIHQFEMQHNNVSDGFAISYALANSVSSYTDITGNSEDALTVYFATNSVPILNIIEAGVANFDVAVFLNEGTTYFITVIRNDNGGANNTGLYVCYIRTGSHEGVLIRTITVSASAGEQNDFQYVYGLMSFESGAGTVDGFTQNLNLNEVAVDPYENFTTYTEVDADDIISKTPTKVFWDDLDNNKVSYVYKDYGVDHFDGDYTHQMKVQSTGHSNGSADTWTWALRNAIGDVNDIGPGNEDAVLLYNPASTQLRIILYNNGGSTVLDTATIIAGTVYYVTIIRNDDGGVNNTGQHAVYIRTGSHEGTLIDTLVVDSIAGAQHDFRYIYAVNTRGLAIGTTDGFIQNLNLNEEAPITSGQIMRILAYNGIHQVILQGVILS